MSTRTGYFREHGTPSDPRPWVLPGAPIRPCCRAPKRNPSLSPLATPRWSPRLCPKLPSRRGSSHTSSLHSTALVRARSISYFWLQRARTSILRGQWKYKGIRPDRAIVGSYPQPCWRTEGETVFHSHCLLLAACVQARSKSPSEVALLIRGVWTLLPARWIVKGSGAASGRWEFRVLAENCWKKEAWTRIWGARNGEISV